MKALREFLRPEFINRVDEVVYFNKLSEENFRSIAELMLKELRDGLAERAMTLTWDDSVLDYLTRKSYSAEFGARNLRRTIQKDIEDKLASDLIDNYNRELTHVALTAQGDAITVIIA